MSYQRHDRGPWFKTLIVIGLNNRPLLNAPDLVRPRVGRQMGECGDKLNVVLIGSRQRGNEPCSPRIT